MQIAIFMRLQFNQQHIIKTRVEGRHHATPTLPTLPTLEKGFPPGTWVTGNGNSRLHLPSCSNQASPFYHANMWRPLSSCLGPSPSDPPPIDIAAGRFVRPHTTRRSVAPSGVRRPVNAIKRKINMQIDAD